MEAKEPSHGAGTSASDTAASHSPNRIRRRSATDDG